MFFARCVGQIKMNPHGNGPSHSSLSLSRMARARQRGLTIIICWLEGTRSRFLFRPFSALPLLLMLTLLHLLLLHMLAAAAMSYASTSAAECLGLLLMLLYFPAAAPGPACLRPAKLVSASGAGVFSGFSALSAGLATTTTGLSPTELVSPSGTSVFSGFSALSAATCLRSAKLASSG